MKVDLSRGKLIPQVKNVLCAICFECGNKSCSWHTSLIIPEGVEYFTKNYCRDDNKFNCYRCIFALEDGRCLIKIFPNTVLHNYDMLKFGATK